jgi:hypothetical protein
MRKTYISFVILSALAIVGIILSQSCGQGDQTKQPAENKTQEVVVDRISQQDGNKSHKFGTNCASCHTTGGSGKGLFTVSGSVLDEARANIQKKCIIKLYTKPKAQGELISTIYSDALGNFYTTEKIDFSAGLYPTLLGTPGVKEDTKHMTKIPIYKGDCNSCHGIVTEKLGID